MAEEEKAESTEERQELDEATQEDDLASQLAAVKKEMKELEAQYKSQISGQDRRHSEDVKEIERLKKERESDKKTMEERMADVEKELAGAKSDKRQAELQAFGRKLLDAVEKKPPPYFDRLIGNDEEETKTLVEGWIENDNALRAELNKERDRRDGRTVHTSTKEVPTSKEKLFNMTDEELEKLTIEEIHEISHGK